MAEPYLDTTRTHRLGTRAFLLFLTRQMRWPLAGAIFFGALWLERHKAFEDNAAARDMTLQIALLVMAALIAYKFVRAYFEYRGYAYRFDDEFFHITRGYVSRNEIGVVYHQIQTVTIQHGVLDRAFGICHLTIVMNGSGEYRPSEVVLPALDHRKAQMVQKEILRKARMHAPRYGPPEPVSGDN